MSAAPPSWILEQCRRVSDGLVGCRGSKAAWDAVRKLKEGLCGVVRRRAPAKMRKPDGSLAASPEENATVYAGHFEQLYGRVPTFDPSVLDLVQQGVDGQWPGSIIHLQHDRTAESVSLVPSIIDIIRNKGYTFVSVPECMYVGVTML